jgi:hypothetical protein
MNRPYVTRLFVSFVFLAFGPALPSNRLLAAQGVGSTAPVSIAPAAPTSPVPAPGSAAVDSGAPIDPNLQVMTRGAVHEAFGQPVLFNPTPSLIVPTKPPDPVQELPPNQRPKGTNVQWIPGYWSWDSNQQKFIWTSGIWRVMPPGLAWVPGYWTQSGTGYQWASGFWRRTQTSLALARLFASKVAGAARGATRGVKSVAGGNPQGNPGAKPADLVAVPDSARGEKLAKSAAGDNSGVASAETGANSAASPGADSAVVVEEGPGTNPSTTPAGADPGADPGAVPGTDPAAKAPGATAGAPGTTPDSPGASSVTNSGADPGTAAGADPGAAASTDHAATPGASPAPGSQSIGSNSVTGTSYLPKPPDSLETGPVGNPPTANFIWIPGTWIFKDGRFRWLAGQWGPCHAGWIWVPAHYVWTPAGYVFVDGFWDYDLPQRGVLFAPVLFSRGIPAAGFVFTPAVVLNGDLLTNFLFCRPQCNCYCFGDYYAANDLQAGVYPWFAFHMSRFGYDPLFACCSWKHRNDAGWHEKLVVDYRRSRDNIQFRPPQTYAALQAFANHGGVENAATLAMPLNKWAARSRVTSLHFEKVSVADREAIRRSVQSLSEVATGRLQFEKTSRVGQPNALIQAASERTIGQREGGLHPVQQASKLTEPARGRTTTSEKPETTFANTRTPAADRTQGMQFKSTSGRSLTTVRTPTVVPRRPVPMADQTATQQRSDWQHPVERLQDPRYVPHPTTQGRSQSGPKVRRG